jgi:hypothetical protein
VGNNQQSHPISRQRCLAERLALRHQNRLSGSRSTLGGGLPARFSPPTQPPRPHHPSRMRTAARERCWGLR